MIVPADRAEQPSVPEAESGQPDAQDFDGSDPS